MIKFVMTEAAARVAIAGGTPEEVRDAGFAYETDCGGAGGFRPELGDIEVPTSKVKISDVSYSIKTLAELNFHPKVFRKAFPALAAEMGI